MYLYILAKDQPSLSTVSRSEPGGGHLKDIFIQETPRKNTLVSYKQLSKSPEVEQELKKQSILAHRGGAEAVYWVSVLHGEGKRHLSQKSAQGETVSQLRLSSAAMKAACQRRAVEWAQ